MFLITYLINFYVFIIATYDIFAGWWKLEFD